MMKFNLIDLNYDKNCFLNVIILLINSIERIKYVQIYIMIYDDQILEN